MTVCKFFDKNFVLLDIVFIQFRLAMPIGKTVFSQLMDLVPEYEFQKCVDKYAGDFHALKFTCRDHFRVMSYAQFTDRASLRDIEATLTVFSAKLYHSGLKFISKSTLAYMNETKDWQIYRDFAMVLITWAQKLYKDDYFRLGLDEMVYAFDSSTIELCLKLCPWAEYREDGGAMKMHTLLNLRGSIPTFIWMTEGKVNDMNGLDVLPVEAGAYYLMDKGYVDFWRLYKYFHLRQAYFVTRAKDNMRFEVKEEREVDMHAGLISDQSIRLTGPLVSRDYPEMMRMVVYEDFATNNVYRFLTNNFIIDALTVAELYRERWQIELFFKWIKQHLHVKSFFGTTKNAVFAQIWIAVCDYLLLVIARKLFHIEQNLYIFSKAIGLVLFEKMPVSELINRIDNSKLEPENDGQGWLF